MQDDDNQDKDINSKIFDFDSDIKDENMDDTMKEKSRYQTKLKKMKKEIIVQSQATVLMKQNIQKLEGKADLYDLS